jgi:hypothetical protein
MAFGSLTTQQPTVARGVHSLPKPNCAGSAGFLSWLVPTLDDRDLILPKLIE